MGQPRTAFVLAGGGSLGAVEVGMLQTLVERGIAPDLVVGASVGAINGAFFAGRPDRAGVESLAAIWRGLRRGDVFPLGLMGGFLAFIGKRPHLIAPDRLRALLGRHLPVARLEEAKVPCHVVATDVLSGEEVCLSSGVAVESVLASTAIPAIFPPVRIADRQLSDGALASNTPLSAALGLGAERLIVLPTGFSCTLRHPPRSALGMALHAVNLMTTRQLVVDIDRFCNTAEIVVVPPLCPLNVSSSDFTHSGQLIDRAAKSTRRWLDEGGLSRREVPGALRPHAHHKRGALGSIPAQSMT
jgi:NTE family protein